MARFIKTNEKREPNIKQAVIKWIAMVLEAADSDILQRRCMGNTASVVLAARQWL